MRKMVRGAQVPGVPEGRTVVLADTLNVDHLKESGVDDPRVYAGHLKTGRRISLMPRVVGEDYKAQFVAGPSGFRHRSALHICVNFLIPTEFP